MFSGKKKFVWIITLVVIVGVLAWVLVPRIFEKQETMGNTSDDVVESSERLEVIEGSKEADAVESPVPEEDEIEATPTPEIAEAPVETVEPEATAEPQDTVEPEESPAPEVYVPEEKQM